MLADRWTLNQFSAETTVSNVHKNENVMFWTERTRAYYTHYSMIKMSFFKVPEYQILPPCLVARTLLHVQFSPA